MFMVLTQETFDKLMEIVQEHENAIGALEDKVKKLEMLANESEGE